MASKLVCDRCGKEIVNRNERTWMNYKVIYSKVTVPLYDLGNRSDIDADLCKECTESFLEWFDKKWEE